MLCPSIDDRCRAAAERIKHPTTPLPVSTPMTHYSQPPTHPLAPHTNTHTLHITHAHTLYIYAVAAFYNTADPVLLTHSTAPTTPLIRDSIVWSRVTAWLIISHCMPWKSPQHCSSWVCSICCSSPTSMDPAHCCSTIHYALSLYLYTAHIFCNYALIIIILLHSIFPLNCLHCNCLIHPPLIFIYVLCNAYSIISVLSSTTASIILLYSSFVMSLLLLSYLIVYSTLSLIFPLCQHPFL